MLINVEHLNPLHLKELASFIYCKQIHSNSTFYNYNISKLSKITKLSTTLIRKHVIVWRANNWTRIVNNNLTLVSLHKLDKKGVRVAENFKDKTYKQILLCLKKIILKHKQSQCLWANEVSADLNNATNLKQYKRALKASKKYCIKKSKTGERQKNLRINLKSIGALIGRSKSSASYFIKQLKHEGLVNVFNEGKKTIYKNVSKKAWGAVQNIKRGTFWSKGMIMYSPCNTYCFL